MSIRNRLARRRAEQRLQRKTRAANRPQVDPEAEINGMIQKYSNRAYRIGQRMFDASQARKAEGKVVLKHTITHGIGVAYRGLMGSKQKPKKGRKK